MEGIKTILERLGIESVGTMAPNEQYVIVRPGQNCLRLKKTAPDRLRVDYHRMNGTDGLKEPTAVFKTRNKAWVPVSFHRPPKVYCYDELGLDIGERLSEWDSRLRDAGFIGNNDRSSERILTSTPGH